MSKDVFSGRARLLTDDPERDAPLVREFIAYQWWTYRDGRERSVGNPPPPPIPPGEIPTDGPLPGGPEIGFTVGTPEDVAHLVDVGHHCGDVLRTPLFATRIEEDRDFHQATSARSERPLIRRQATSATARMRSS